MTLVITFRPNTIPAVETIIGVSAQLSADPSFPKYRAINLFDCALFEDSFFREMRDLLPLHQTPIIAMFVYRGHSLI